MKKIILFFFVIFLPLSTYGASCCGGGSSSSAIITGDTQQELTLGYSYRNDIGQTDNNGLATLHNSSIIDQQFLYTFQLARMFFDRFQSSLKIGVTTKEIDKQKRAEKNSGLQDIEVQSSYEFMPEYTYSPIKPRGFSYLKFAIPMSKSLYDSTSPVFSDVRGTGQFSVAPGLFFIKKLTALSLKSGVEYQYYLGKQYSEFKLDDYYKFIVPFGISYPFSLYPVTLSATSTWNYQSPKKLNGSIQSRSASEYFWDLNISTSLHLANLTSFTLAYSDSTLIGKNINSPLYRIIGLSYNYGWPL